MSAAISALFLRTSTGILVCNARSGLYLCLLLVVNYLLDLTFSTDLVAFIKKIKLALHFSYMHYP